MSATTVANVNITVDRDSLADIPMAEYIERLEQAIRAWPDVTEDTDISITPDICTKYTGYTTDGDPFRHDELTDRLHQQAQDVFEAICRGD